MRDGSRRPPVRSTPARGHGWLRWSWPGFCTFGDRLAIVDSENISSRSADVIATAIDGATQLRDDNRAGCSIAVLAGLDRPSILFVRKSLLRRRWMPGSSPGMTGRELSLSQRA